ncbi:MAG: 1-acyl-sn-glycerol-3-phosphate acyltransferase [Propionibacteriaceae bacterium]|jgi:1-acyl-sn-glycerol-3-phosphate acyltransferase|nr:1-acyl-sn-glycerol-3-phosphate acyltransferase [Propionibacteriaceae bacterium]
MRAYAMVHGAGHILRWLVSPKLLHTEHIPVTGAAVLAGNHFNAADPLLVAACTKRYVGTLAKKELFDGWYGFIFRAIGSIPVVFSRTRNTDALQAAVAVLQDGHLVNVSPEAGRNFSTELLLPFKGGAVAMAQRAGCPIIPYTIVGNYRFRSRNLAIRFGEPLDVSTLSFDAAMTLLRDTISQMLTADGYVPVGARQRNTG